MRGYQDLLDIMNLLVKIKYAPCSAQAHTTIIVYWRSHHSRYLESTIALV